MAEMAIDDARAEHSAPAASDAVTGAARSATGLGSYYQTQLDALEVTLRERQQNLRRLEAQRNSLNSKGAWRGGGGVEG